MMFKVGDKVKIRPENWANHFGDSLLRERMTDEIATITEIIYENPIIYSVFFESVKNKSYDSRDPLTYAWWFWERHIKLAQKRENPTYEHCLKILNAQAN